MISGSKLKFLGTMVFGIFLLIWIISFADFSEVNAIIKNTSLMYVFIGFLAVTGAFLMRTWRWKILLRASGQFLPGSILFKTLLFGFFLNYLIPARAGDIARSAVLKTIEKIPAGISLTTIIIERAMDMFTLALLFGLAAVLVLKSNNIIFIAIASFMIAFLMIAILLLIYKYNDFISGKLGKKFPGISGFLKSMKEGIYSIYTNPNAMVVTIIFSISVWIFEISGVYMAGLAIGYKIPFSIAAVAGISSFLSQTIPITPGGLGIYEGTMASVLVLFGIPLSVGISMAIVDHFVRTAVVLVFGMISTIQLGFASNIFSFQYELKSEKDT